MTRARDKMGISEYERPRSGRVRRKRMFDDIGGKIKNVAKYFCYAGMAISVIAAVFLWMANSRYEPTIALGFGVLTGGICGSWLGSLTAYGFGELIESTQNNSYYQKAILEELKALRSENAKSFEQVERRLDEAVRAAAAQNEPVNAQPVPRIAVVSEQPVADMSAGASLRRQRRTTRETASPVAGAGSSALWRCRECGCYNDRTRSVCKSCGQVH